MTEQKDKLSIPKSSWKELW